MHTFTFLVTFIICFYLKRILKTLPGTNPIEFSVLLHIGQLEQFHAGVLKIRLFWKGSSPELAVENVNLGEGCEILSPSSAVMAESGLQVVTAICS